MRTFGIWLCGLLAGAIIGGLLGSAVSRDSYDAGGNMILGVVGGMVIFTCVRLWTRERRGAV